MMKSLSQLEQEMDEGIITSVDLVKYYLDRIEKYDRNGLKLNSIGEINPDAMKIAEELDEERRHGKKRSSLHGIPIVIKDNIHTKDAMHTSAGSIAFKDMLAPYEAPLVTKLKDAGMIILGKTNLSEFANFISDDLPNGFSANFGQVISPYHDYIDPLGSSTGSAVAVAADLAPVSIGTETNGSLTSPAEMNCIVTLKPTVGLVSGKGIIPISVDQDTAGPMAGSVEDCAILMDHLSEKQCHFLDACHKPVNKLKIGFISFDRAYDEEEKMIFREAKQLFEDAGCIIKDIHLKGDGVDNMTCLLYEFKRDMNLYLETIKDVTKIHSLHDLITFNNEDPAHRCPFNQNIFISAEKTTGTESEEYQNAKKKQMEEAMHVIDLMNANDLDVVVSIHAIEHAPIAGFPSLSVPAKKLTDLKPISIVFSARHNEDEKLVTAGCYYEKKTMRRTEPDLERVIKEVKRDGAHWYQNYTVK